jgi:hypothetical protein
MRDPFATDVSNDAGARCAEKVATTAGPWSIAEVNLVLQQMSDVVDVVKARAIV